MDDELFNATLEKSASILLSDLKERRNILDKAIALIEENIKGEIADKPKINITNAIYEVLEEATKPYSLSEICKKIGEPNTRKVSCTLHRLKRGKKLINARRGLWTVPNIWGQQKDIKDE